MFEALRGGRMFAQWVVSAYMSLYFMRSLNLSGQTRECGVFEACGGGPGGQ